MLRRLSTSAMLTAATAAPQQQQQQRTFVKAAQQQKEKETTSASGGASAAATNVLYGGKSDGNAVGGAGIDKYRKYFTPKLNQDQKVWGNEEDEKNISSSFNKHRRLFWNIKRRAVYTFLPISWGAAFLGLPVLGLEGWEHLGAACLALWLGWRGLIIKPKRNPLVADLSGRNVMVLGTSKLALSCAAQFQAMGASVRVVGPPTYKDTTSKYLAKVASAKTKTGSLEYVECDATDPPQVRTMTQAYRTQVKSLDLLVNCHHYYPFDGAETSEPTGDELTVAHNFLAPFHVTERLLDVVTSSKGRVVNVTSASHQAPIWHYLVRKIVYANPKTVDQTKDNALRRFGATMLMGIYHANSLAQVEGVQGVSVNAVNLMRPADHVPEIESTNVLDYVFNLTAWEASQSIVNASIRPDLHNGGYYTDCSLDKPGKDRLTYDDAFAQELMEWAVSRTIKRSSGGAKSQAPTHSAPPVGGEEEK